MSSTIFYKNEIVVFSEEMTGFNKPIYAWMSLLGSSNTYSHSYVNSRWIVKRSRDWKMLFIGEKDALIAESCETAAELIGGNVRMYGRLNYKPESFIKKIESLCKSAKTITELSELSVTVKMERKLSDWRLLLAGLNHAEQIILETKILSVLESKYKNNANYMEMYSTKSNEAFENWPLIVEFDNSFAEEIKLFFKLYFSLSNLAPYYFFNIARGVD